MGRKQIGVVVAGVQLCLGASALLNAQQDMCRAGCSEGCTLCLAAPGTGAAVSEGTFFFLQPHFIIWASTTCLSFQSSVAQNLLARINSPLGWSSGPCVAHLNTRAVWQAHGSPAGGSHRCRGELGHARSKSIVSHQLLPQGAPHPGGVSPVKPERREVQRGPDVWGAIRTGPPKPM